jgi:hypothetical protein
MQEVILNNEGVTETDNRGFEETVVRYKEDSLEVTVSIPFAMWLVENALENSLEEGEFQNVLPHIQALKAALECDHEPYSRLYEPAL